jgi:uncharacterized protein (DUF2225 family)
MIIFDMYEIKGFAYEKFHDHTSLRVVTYLYIAWEELGSSRGKKHLKKLKLSFLVDVVFHEKKPLSPPPGGSWRYYWPCDERAQYG